MNLPSIQTKTDIPYSKNDSYHNIFKHIFLMDSPELSKFGNLNEDGLKSLEMSFKTYLASHSYLKMCLRNRVTPTPQTPMYGYTDEIVYTPHDIFQICAKTFLNFGIKEYDHFYTFRTNNLDQYKNDKSNAIFNNMVKVFTNSLNVVGNIIEPAIDIINFSNKCLEFIICKNYAAFLINEDLNISDFPEISENVGLNDSTFNMKNSLTHIHYKTDCTNLNKYISEMFGINLNEFEFMVPSLIITPGNEIKNKIKRPIVFYDTIIPFIYHNKHHNYIFSDKCFKYPALYINSLSDSEPVVKNQGLFKVFKKNTSDLNCKSIRIPRLNQNKISKQNVTSDAENIFSTLYKKMYYKIKFNTHISESGFTYLKCAKDLHQL